MTSTIGTPDDGPLVLEGGTNSPTDKDSATQAVTVAVHIRPLLSTEQLQGCKDCINVVLGEPQVQIGNHSFTFDHVYGSIASPSTSIFEDCVAPLVEGLFHGYNATVLAYGQTGSGKTFTMGTGYIAGGNTDSVIPQVMEMIYKKLEGSTEKVQFQIRVSFIEILKEEVHDLLDLNTPTSTRPDMFMGCGTRPTTPVKSGIQIRETTNGEITLAGVTEIDVCSLHEMAACLEQGSLCRATASTNMNLNSSRSHAIFTITLEQHRKWELLSNGNVSSFDNGNEEVLCAKLHLVDLAGSERVKRTGADGLRFKEGVHINKGLLALGNVISALGDEKKRKDGGHVPYRDSKLTRLLQDSLGGNSRTVMIACVSPADSNAEETLNTLKYANRARNIQNKPLVNRDPVAEEMQHMRQQVELLQAELLCIRAGGGTIEDTQMLKQKIAWLEANNTELRQELQQARDGLQVCAQRVMDALVERDKLHHKLEQLRAGVSWHDLDDNRELQGEGLLQAYTTKIQELESNIQKVDRPHLQALTRTVCHPIVTCLNGSAVSNGDHLELHDGQHGDLANMACNTREAEEEAAATKELEHTCLQVSMDNELQELNKRLEQKEAEMKTFVKFDNVIMKQHFEKKLMELEEEKNTLQLERDTLLVKIENLACASDEHAHKMQDSYVQKLKSLESQLLELKQKQDNQAQLLKQKLRSDEAAKRLHEEIQRIKTQKVQLQHRIKQESEQFRFWKASREKELLQLRKEGRKNEYEMHKLQALNQRQKMVLQRKTEEAAMATRRLKELLEARKSSGRENASAGVNAANGSTSHVNLKSLQRLTDHELEVAVHIHGVRNDYEKQADLRASLAKELETLKQEEKMQQMMLEPHQLKSDEMQLSPLAVSNTVTISNASQARIEILENMLDASSCTLVAMASELSEAEERQQVFSSRGSWQHLRTIGDAKNLLQYIFNTAVYARCQLWDKELENKELNEQISELTELLRQSEAHRKEIGRQQHLRDQVIAKAIATSTKVGSEVAIACGIQDISISPFQGIGSQEVDYAESGSDSFSSASGGYRYDIRKGTSGAPSVGAKQTHAQIGKLLRWKRSHQRWLLQFKWKWQKPWRLSELIRHGDDSLTRPRSFRFANAMEIR